jgi:threonine/homoserine/homoserine lactone efflux protein
MPAVRILEFVAFSLLAIISPGPDNLSVISYGMFQGRRAGMLFGAGCATGCLLHTLWLTIGLAGLLAASSAAFSVLKIAGACYLFYLASQAFRSRGLIRLDEAKAGNAPMGGIIFLRRGFLANALNPKVALFFLAVLPPFTAPGGIPIPLQFLFLGLLFAFLTLIVFGCIGAGAGAVGEYLKGHSRIGVWLDRLAGVVFVTLGLVLLFSQLDRKH